jgi:ABC-2 type transport system permease protein
MNGLGAFLGKELRETRKTWRLWVVPGILLFFGLSSPILAAVTPAILKATADRTPGVRFTYPTPTAVDAYTQYLGNLAQIALLAIIITGAAAIAGERRAGTAVLMLTKPLSRAGFVVAKALSGLALVVVATVLGSALCIVTTLLLFDAGLIGRFVVSVGLWLVLAALFVTLMVFLSAAMDRQAPAAGTGVGVYVALFALTGFPIVRDHTPAGLLAANDALLRGRHVALAWPLATTALLAVACVVAAVVAFRRKEL